MTPILIIQSTNKRKIIIDFEINRHVVNAVRGIDGRKFNPETRVWELSNKYDSMLKLAGMLQHTGFPFVVDPKLQEDFNKAFQEMKQKLDGQKEAASIKMLPEGEVSADIFKPFWNEKYMLFPFQRIGALFAKASKGLCMIADEMGLGKTPEALAYIAMKKWEQSKLPDGQRENHRAIICTLASAKMGLANEIVKFTNPVLKYKVLWGGDVLSPDDDIDVLIINYQQTFNAKGKESLTLESLLNLVRSGYFSTIILDESQTISNSTSLTTQAIKENFSCIPERMCLTGTPIRSHTIQLWPQLNFIDPVRWGNRFSFALRYCDAKKVNGFYDYSGSSNLNELSRELEPYFIRRLKEDVMKELPPKLYKTVPIMLEPEEQKAYEDIEYEFMQQYVFEDSLGTLALMQKLKKFTSQCKIIRLKEYVESIFEQEKKAIIFSQYVEIVDSVCEMFPDACVRLVGKDVPAKKRQLLVDDFQNKSDKKLFVSTIQAGYAAITLTAASNVIFIDQPWTPGDMAQGEDRAHRSGQLDSVLVTVFECIGTIDSKIRQMLDEKRVEAQQAIDNGQYLAAKGKRMNVKSDVLDYYREKAKTDEVQRKLKNLSKIHKARGLSNRRTQDKLKGNQIE